MIAFTDNGVQVSTLVDASITDPVPLPIYNINVCGSKEGDLVFEHALSLLTLSFTKAGSGACNTR